MSSYKMNSKAILKITCAMNGWIVKYKDMC